MQAVLSTLHSTDLVSSSAALMAADIKMIKLPIFSQELLVQ